MTKYIPPFTAEEIDSAIENAMIDKSLVIDILQNKLARERERNDEFRAMLTRISNTSRAVLDIVREQNKHLYEALLRDARDAMELTTK